MASLLDFLGGEDAQLGMSLLAAASPRMQPAGFGERLYEGMRLFREQKENKEDRALKKMLVEAQSANYQSEADARKAAIAKASQANSVLQQILGGQQYSVPEGFDMRAPGAENQVFSRRGAGGGLMNATPDQVALLKSLGYDFTDVIKTFQPQTISAGSYTRDPRTGATTYHADPTKGVTMDGGKVAPMPGAIDALSEIAGATTGAQKRAEADWTLPPDRPMADTGRPFVGTQRQLIDALRAVGGGAFPLTGAQPPAGGVGGPNPTNPGNIRPVGGGPGSGFQQYGSAEDGLQAIQRQLKIYGEKHGVNTLAGVISRWAPPNENNTPALIDNASRMLGIPPDQKINLSDPVQNMMIAAALVRQEQGPKLWQGAAAPSASAGFPGRRPADSPVQFAGPSDIKADEARIGVQAGAQKSVNDAWLKNVYEPAVTSGREAGRIIESAQIMRQLLPTFGAGGWGTELRSKAANVLVGLGVQDKDVDKFATDAKRFGSVAMDRLWTVLNEAKGPQTEGDADRARQTYVQLDNPVQANMFILDLAQARAERDAAKARFFNQAMPIAAKEGNLQKVEAEWQRLAPSIFEMPTMQKWNAR